MKIIEKIVCVAIFGTASSCFAAAPGASEERSAFSVMARAQALLTTSSAEAQAKIISAQATLITAVSTANINNAKALQTVEQTRTIALDNDLKRADTFHKKRALYEASRITSKKPTQEDVMRYSRASLPERPKVYDFDPVKNKIYWPELLQQEQFTTYRLQMDVLFLDRDNTANDRIQEQAKIIADQMQNELCSLIHQSSPEQYLKAKKFIQSLAFETRFPLPIQGLANN